MDIKIILIAIAILLGVSAVLGLLLAVASKSSHPAGLGVFLFTKKQNKNNPTKTANTTAVPIICSCDISYAIPWNPAKAIAMNPAIIKAIAAPLNGLGIGAYSIFSRIPAKIYITKI